MSTTCLECYILLGNLLEARVGIEPTNEGFADLSLTTWVPRPNEQYNQSHCFRHRNAA